MPNTPALVDEGMAAISAGSHCDAEHLTRAEAMLTVTGKVLRVPEKQQDAVTAISGSGPAYLFFVVEAMNAALTLWSSSRRIAAAVVPPGDAPLLDDVVTVLCDVVGSEDESVAGWQRMHDVVERNLELLPRIKQHMQALAEEAATQLTARRGIDLPAAHAAVAVGAAVIELALRDCLSDPGIGMAKADLAENLGTIARSGTRPWSDDLRRLTDRASSHDDAALLKAAIYGESSLSSNERHRLTEATTKRGRRTPG